MCFAFLLIGSKSNSVDCIESEMECGVQSKNNRTSRVMAKAVSLVLLTPAISCIGIAECSQNQKIQVCLLLLAMWQFQ